jgi:hypothetical protein
VVPDVTRDYLPGWVFNVATIAHGEEAFLAAVFLFTVHFFNNHFRPDKFPVDIHMFTGTVPVEEIRQGPHHPVPPPGARRASSTSTSSMLRPQPMTTGSKILGFVLIAAGLSLLTLVLVGFFS